MATLSAGISIQPIPILFGGKVCYISTNSVGGVLYLLLILCISCWNFKLMTNSDCTLWSDFMYCGTYNSSTWCLKYQLKM